MFVKKRIDYQLLLRRVCLMSMDVVLIILSSVMALATRFEFRMDQIPEEFGSVLQKYEIWFVLITLVVFVAWRIYSSLWEYAGIEEAFKIIGAVILSTLCVQAVVVATTSHLPRSYYVLRTIYLVILVGGSRFCYRLFRLHYRRRPNLLYTKKKRIMLIGAGEAGRLLIQEIQNSRYLDQKICCVIDDNRRKIGRYIMGIRIVGDRNSIKRNVERYRIEQIIIAIPSAEASKLRPVLDICKDTGCELKILPGVYQLVNGEVNVSKLRQVNIDDLLGRDEIAVNIDEIIDYVSGKTILVTGGGGSIGSELCRQIAPHNPARLIIFDIYENNAYDIQQELNMEYPDLRRDCPARHELHRLLPGQLKALQLQLLLADLPHLRLQGLQVLGGEGAGGVKVVVKAVVDAGADGQLHLRVQALHGLGQDMGAGVPVSFAVLLVVKAEFVVLLFGHKTVSFLSSGQRKTPPPTIIRGEVKTPRFHPAYGARPRRS